jgi:hypothetical protein
MDPDIMRIISDYNYNQEKYNRNMSSLIQLLTTRVEIVSFTPSDLSSLFDLSGNNAFGSNAFNNNIVGINEGVSLSEITTGTTVQPHSGGALICPITMESVNEGESVMKINRCGHMFKETALRQWLDAHNRCPLCRGGI